MAKFSQGVFHPKNMHKFIGNKSPTYRSSWEHRVMIWLDESPAVISWASEPIKIPYLNPMNPKQNGQLNSYIPDFLIKYVDKQGRQHTELIEIKPLKETMMESARSKKDKIALAVNINKWQQAEAWCKQRGIVFRVLTEADIFGMPKKKK